MAEERGELKLTELVENILCQNEVFKRFLDDKRTEIQSTNYKITQTIALIYDLRENLKKKIRERQMLGNPDVIQNEINKIEKHIEHLRATAGFTQEENKLYVELISSKKQLEHEITVEEKMLAQIDQFHLSVKNGLNTLLTSNVNEYFYQAQENNSVSKEDALTKIMRDFAKVVNASSLKIAEFINEQKKEVLAGIQAKIELIQRIQLDLDPFLAKVTNQELLRKYVGDLEVQGRLLDAIRLIFPVELQFKHY